MNAFVLEGRTTISREELQGTSTFTNTTLDVFHRRLGAFFQVFHQQVFVDFQRSFDQLGAIGFNVVQHVCWHVSDFVIFWQARVIPYVGFLAQQVNNTNKFVFGADGQNHNQRAGGQYIFDLVDNAEEVGTEAVQLVHEDNTGDFGVVGVAPVGLRLWLNTTGTAEYADTAIQYFQ